MEKSSLLKRPVKVPFQRYNYITQPFYDGGVISNVLPVDPQRCRRVAGHVKAGRWNGIMLGH